MILSNAATLIFWEKSLEKKAILSSAAQSVSLLLGRCGATNAAPGELRETQNQNEPELFTEWNLEGPSSSFNLGAQGLIY